MFTKRLQRAHFIGAALGAAGGGIGIGTVLSAASSLASFLMQRNANEEAAKKREAEIRRAYDIKERYGQESRQKILENANQYDPSQRTGNLVDAENEATKGVESVLAEYRPTDVGPEVQGKISDAFLSAQAKAEAGNLSRAHDYARRLGRLMGYSGLATEENANNARTGGELAAITGDRSGELGVSSLRLANIEPDQTGTMIGDLGAFAAGLANRRGASPTPYQTPVVRSATSGGLPAGWRLTT